MSVKLRTEHQLEFISLKDGYTGSSESTLVETPHCWKLHVPAQMYLSWDKYKVNIVPFSHRKHIAVFQTNLILTLYLIEVRFNAYVNRAGPDQELPDQGRLCLRMEI